MIDFDKLIDDFLYREIRQREPNRYYPSEVGLCMRKIWYSYKIPKAADLEMRRLFHMGTKMHELVVEILRSERNKDVVLLQSEFPIVVPMEGFVISGRADDLVLVKVSGKNVLVEVKSTGPNSLGYLNAPKPEHLMQLQLYMHANGSHYGMLLYIERDRLRTKSFEVEYSREEIEKIFGRFREIHKSMSSGVIPEPEARIKSGMRWMCKWCPWRKECYEETPASAEAP